MQWFTWIVATLIILIIFSTSIIKYCASKGKETKQNTEMKKDDLNTKQKVSRTHHGLNHNDQLPLSDSEAKESNDEAIDGSTPYDQNATDSLITSTTISDVKDKDDKNEFDVEQYKIPTELPYSLQQFIDFASNIINENKVIDLEWDKIDKDIKMQYIQYTNKDTFTRLYYNYDAPDKNDYMFKFPDKYNQINKQRFSGEHSIIHFIFSSLFGIRTLRKQYQLNDSQMHKARLNGCKMIKLLIENDAITGEEIFLCYSFGVTIIEAIADGIKSIDTMKVYNLLHEDHNFSSSDDGKSQLEDCEKHYEKYQIEILEALIDLLACCFNNVDTCKYAIFTNEIVCWEYDDSDDGNTDSGARRHLLKSLNIWDSMITYSEPLRNQCLIPNNHQIIKRMLFRGITPFNFQIKTNNVIHYELNNDGFYENVSDVMQKKITDGRGLTKQLWNEIDNVQLFSEEAFDNALGIISPLLFYADYCDAKKEMFELLTNCLDLFDVIIEVIVSYLYIDYDMYYCKTFRDDKKVKEFGNIQRLIKFYNENTSGSDSYHYITKILKDCKFIDQTQLYDWNDESSEDDADQTELMSNGSDI